MVQSSPQIQRKHSGNGMAANESLPDHSAHWTNQHRDALRLALGSILTPKRAPTSRSSSSGTASPAHPHTPPVSDHQNFLHPHYVPSKLSLSTSDSTARDFPSSTPLPYSHVSPDHSAVPSPFPLTRTTSTQSQKGEPVVAEVHAPTPSKSPPHIEAGATAAASGSGSGSGTPKAKFIETLQGKSAWDALIHGSFS